MLRPGRILAAAEHQELLRHAVEALGLASDVRDELAHGVRVHLILQNRIGKQLDRRQRRFQLMRGIGYELPLHLLGFLQTVGQLVEFLGEHRIFVRTVHLDLVRIFALARKAHGCDDLPHPPGAGNGEKDGEDQDRSLQNNGAAENVRLEIGDQLPLLGVVVHDIDAADRLVVGNDRHGRVAAERSAAIDAVKSVVSHERLHHLAEQHKLPLRTLRLIGIVECAALGVGDDEACDVQIAQHRNDLLRRLARERIKPAERRGDQLQLILRGGILGL